MRHVRSFLITFVVIGVAMWLSESRTGRVVLAVGAFFGGLALAIVWLSGAGRRDRRRSVTNPSDLEFWQGSEPDHRPLQD